MFQADGRVRVYKGEEDSTLVVGVSVRRARAAARARKPVYPCQERTSVHHQQQ
jgi:hypothetical protein